ncbi:MAG: succinate dehydrogenase iron-sulfur subunit [Candidatus Marinimicrobia bacterium]|nr:succinate dehydrogenase iron-sulfur subunit [Candidatus Neomarinimicrobiota bacterium]MDD5582403.1 succinate dehydrogenase iron-sulfur subunit [Candidatus Neomarinimicrobiota bacterium]
MEKKKTKQFKIFRFNPKTDKRHYFDTFDVPYEAGMTVLQALNYIQRNLDGSLAYRSSCREGICGSCAMHINGKYCLACETQVIHVKGTVTIRPMAHLDIIKDLVVDMNPFFEKLKAIKPYLIPGDPDEGAERIQTQDERAYLNTLVDCILCGACYASCAVNGFDEDYLGPAALAKVNRFFMDSRDKADEQRLALVSDEHGVFRCHTLFNCQVVCPKNVNPTANIANLKRQIIARSLTVKFSKKGM